MVSSPPSVATLPAPLASERRTAHAAAIFAQMLPATLVAPAVRPLFALHHAGHEGAMHAFMSVNMIGAAVAAGLLAMAPRLRARVTGDVLALLLADAALLALVALRLPLSVVLSLRCLEGALHVTTATALFAQAAAWAKVSGDRRGVPLAGAFLVFAVALGHLVGGLLVGIDPRAPFFAGALLLGGVTPLLVRRRSVAPESPAARPSLVPPGGVARGRSLLLPAAAAFVARFTVGCLVVTFALFAHRAHHLSDRTIGILFAAMTLPFAAAMYPAGLLAARLRATSLFVGSLVYAALLASLAVLPTAGLAAAMVAMGIASALVFASVLAFATEGRSGGSRSRAIACVNGAGCLGMLVGPAAAGITCAVLRTPLDPCRGYTSTFALAAASVVVFCLASLPRLARPLVQELMAPREAALPEER